MGNPASAELDRKFLSPMRRKSAHLPTTSSAMELIRSKSKRNRLPQEIRMDVK